MINRAETQAIAHHFLQAHPFLGDITWERLAFAGRAVDPEDRWPVTLTTPGWGRREEQAAEALPEGHDVPEGHEESWRVRFADPTGKPLTLTHMCVLQGLRWCVYEDTFGSLEQVTVTTWMSTPAAVRPGVELPGWAVDRVCQAALFSGFPYGGAQSADPSK